MIYPSNMKVTNSEFISFIASLQVKIDFLEDELAYKKAVLRAMKAHKLLVAETERDRVNEFFHRNMELMECEVGDCETRLTNLKVDLMIYKDAFDECKKRGFLEADTD